MFAISETVSGGDTNIKDHVGMIYQGCCASVQIRCTKKNWDDTTLPIHHSSKLLEVYEKSECNEAFLKIILMTEIWEIKYYMKDIKSEDQILYEGYQIGSVCKWITIWSPEKNKNYWIKSVIYWWMEVSSGKKRINNSFTFLHYLLREFFSERQGGITRQNVVLMMYVRNPSIYPKRHSQITSRSGDESPQAYAEDQENYQVKRKSQNMIFSDHVSYDARYWCARRKKQSSKIQIWQFDIFKKAEDYQNVLKKWSISFLYRFQA